MRERPLILIAGLLLVPWLAVASAQAAKPRVAVVPMVGEQLGVDVRSKLDAAVAGGLAASGAEVVDGVDTAKRIRAKGLGGCDTSTCRIAIADATGARYLIRGSVEIMGRSYSVRLEMVDGATGGVVGIREDRCEICTEAEVYETASLTASALKAEIWKRAAAPRGEGGDPGAPSTTGGKAVALTAPPAAPAREVPGLVSPGPGAAPGGQGQPTRVLPVLSWIGVGAGVAAIAAGYYLVSINHDLTCDHGPGVNCEFRYKTRTSGIALMGGGALVAAIGATLLIGRF
jgi:hypothetical protein